MNTRTLCFASVLVAAAMILSPKVVRAGTVTRCADGSFSDVCTATVHAPQVASAEVKKLHSRPVPRGAVRHPKAEENELKRLSKHLR